MSPVNLLPWYSCYAVVIRQEGIICNRWVSVVSLIGALLERWAEKVRERKKERKRGKGECELTIIPLYMY